MNTIYIVISFLLLSSYLVSADQCAASVTVQPRKGASWTSNGVNYQQYDIYVVNTGSCAFTTLFGLLGFPSSNRVTNSFNYNPSTGQISGFGPSLAPQAIFTGAGFTLSGPGTPTITSIKPTCPCTSSSGTPAPATSAPTLAATLAPTSAPTLAATFAPTSTPVGEPENCYNACSEQEVCARLSEDPFPRCHPRTCAALTCESNEICLSNGGLARCIVISGTATPTVAAGPTNAPTRENCYNVCDETEVCVALDESGVPKCNPRECRALTCNSTSVCINNGGVARCIQTQAPSPTSTPTVIPTTPTVSATSTPSTGRCTVSVSIIKRANGSHTSNGVPSQIYDLVFTSYSATTVNSINVVITPSAGASISQEWNLNSMGGNTYSVRTYGALNAQGASYYGSGFVVSGDSVTPAVSVSGTTCA